MRTLAVLAARVALAVVLGSIVASMTTRPVAADEGWLITDFRSDITVATDSSLTITEVIDVDFGTQQHHGIFRTIPLRYRYNDNQDRYYELSVQAVTNGRDPVPYDASVDGDNEVIRIGDPNVLVTGPQGYVITYKVVGAMNSFSDHDELYWNVDGALWPVRKQKVSATVHVPAGSFMKAACFEGQPASTEACSSEPSGDTIAFAAGRPLASGEQMSIVVGLNPGAVTVPGPLVEDRLRFFPFDTFDINPMTVGLSLVILVAGLAFVAWNWWRHGRDREYLMQYYLTNDPRERTEPLFTHEAVTVEFGPPENMRPAEVGLVLDEVADPKDVTATIVDLAVRGFMTITEVPEWEDWKFTSKPGGDASTLLPYEETLLDAMFAGRKEVKLSELHGTFAATLHQAESQIYADAVTKRLFSTNPRQARASWGCLGVAVLLGGCALSVVLGLALGWGLVGAAIAVVGLLLTISFPFMPQRTAAGHDVLHHALGFRLYMTTAEKYREQFAAKAGIFNEFLPYAIVFGCVALWAKAFEGIDTSATSGWYVGRGPFQAALLAGNLQSMNSSIQSAITYVPQSTPGGRDTSGFSGGGGFAGGGGGGGGGGAW